MITEQEIEEERYNEYYKKRKRAKEV